MSRTIPTLITSSVSSSLNIRKTTPKVIELNYGFDAEGSTDVAREALRLTVETGDRDSRRSVEVPCPSPRDTFVSGLRRPVPSEHRDHSKLRPELKDVDSLSRRNPMFRDRGFGPDLLLSHRVHFTCSPPERTTTEVNEALDARGASRNIETKPTRDRSNTKK